MKHKQEPTRAQYALRARLVAIIAAEQPPLPATDDPEHYGCSGVSSDETPSEGGML